MASVIVASVVLASVVASSGDAPALRAQWRYNGVHQPVWIDVVPPDSASTVSLALMDGAGNLHAELAEVSAGRADLATLMPDIARMRWTGYLQMIVEGEPIGSALVIQPMLSRLVPVTEEAINPNGIRYTRVVAWRDELASADPRAETGADRETDDEGEPAATVEPADETRATVSLMPGMPERPADPWLANQEPGERLFTGWRVYAERDVVLHTTDGDIRLAMRPEDAPNTVWNFLELSEGGFFRSIPFHRVVPFTRDGDPFVIQAGDPTGTGNGGPGYWLPLEPSTLAHDFGVISMARDVDPDSAGSQIFICLSREGTARLDGHYCAFGFAVEGAETILAIASVTIADIASGRPAAPPVIRSAELVPAPPRRLGAGRPDKPVQRRPEAAESQPERVPR